MSFREAFALPALAGLSLWRALSRTRPPDGAFRILLLHGVPETRRDAFARMLDRVSAGGGFISPRDAAERLGAGASNDRPDASYLLTFDDGFVSNATVAREILRDRGIKAIFFVCPGLIDMNPADQAAAVARNVLAGEASDDAEPLMSWDQIGELHTDGHVIGAHSLTHRRLTTLDGAALEDEVAGSGARIGEILGARPDWFAFPFGDIGSVDAPALRTIARHYRYCRSGVRGLNARGTPRMALLGNHVDLSTTPAWQDLTVAGGLDFRYRAARARLAAMAGHVNGSAAP